MDRQKEPEKDEAEHRQALVENVEGGLGFNEKKRFAGFHPGQFTLVYFRNLTALFIPQLGAVEFLAVQLRLDLLDLFMQQLRLFRRANP